MKLSLSVKGLRSPGEIDWTAVAAQLPLVTHLELSAAQELSTLEGLPPLPQVNSLCVHKASTLPSLAGLETLPSLTVVETNFAHALHDVRALGALPNLQRLELPDSTALTQLDGLERGGTKLSFVNLKGAIKLRQLDGLSQARGLQELVVSNCSALEHLDGLRNHAKLSRLWLTEAQHLRSIAGLSGCTKLAALELHKARQLAQLDGLEACPALRSLVISGAPGLRDFAVLRSLGHFATKPNTSARKSRPRASLQLLELDGFDDGALLGSLDGLQSLVLLGLPTLSRLDLREVSGLRTLRIHRCPKLGELLLPEGLETLELRDLPALPPRTERPGHTASR